MKTQTQTKHTPGPWLWADGHETSIAIYAVHPIHPGTITRSHEPIAEIPRPDVDGRGWSEANANAALIAAAPELLEALREMLAISLRVDDLAWADAVGKGKGIGPCDKARQAIAKAEGGEA